MAYIFYDLETTEVSPVGQILEAHFIFTDKEYKEITTFGGRIKVGPLHLPSPDAIGVTKIKILDHQEKADFPSEMEFCKRLYDWIESCFQKSKDMGEGEKVYLVSYNNLRFDLRHLRTTFIRNGINPYFNQKLVPKDLLHVVQYGFSTDSMLRRLVLMTCKNLGLPKLSLSLSVICNTLNIQMGSVTEFHSAKWDTEVLLELARLLSDRYKVTISDFVNYLTGGDRDESSYVREFMSVNYDYDLEAAAKNNFTNDDEAVKTKRIVQIAKKNNSSLWLDLDAAIADQKEEKDPQRKNVMYVNAKYGYLPFPRSNIVMSENVPLVAEYAEQFNVDSFFRSEDKDVEAYIYQLSFQEIGVLGGALHQGKVEDLATLSKAAQQVYLRTFLSTYEGSLKEEEIWPIFRSYVEYRYGGKMILAAGMNEEGELEKITYHETLPVRLEKIQAVLDKETNGEVRDCFEQLMTFYRLSLAQSAFSEVSK